MKTSLLRTLFLFILSAYSFHNIIGQDNCCTALPLFGPNLGGGAIPPPAPPPIQDVFPCGCIQSETSQSRWFRFSCTSSGTFEMLIEPFTISDTDFDFALYTACACESDIPVACDTIDSKATGIADEPFLTFGIDPPYGFTPTVNLVEGQNYYLFVDNITGNWDIPSFQFGGTAGLGAPIYEEGPPISGPTEVCPGETATYTSVINQLSNPFDWNEWNIFPYVQSTMTINTDDLTVEWPETPGTYQICVRTLKQCGNTDTTCLTVNINEIPVEEVDGYICSGQPYYDAYGNPYFFPGTYTVNHESPDGCDSIEVLHLEAAPSEFIVNAMEKCQGDCIDFDGETICESGTYQKVYSNQFGCDSTIVLNFISVPTESVIEGLDTLSCKKPSFELDGSMSLGGEDLTYEWVLGGETVSTDPTLSVTEGGTYTLITRSVVAGDTCEVEESVEVIADFDEPENVMATGGEISCLQTSVTLMGSSSTPGVVYHWEGDTGFESSEQNPTVSQAGEYTLTVTAENGCTSSQTIEVTGNTAAPEASGSGGTITCDNASVQLTGSSSIPASTYVWISQFGDVFNEQNPTVTQAAQYTLTVTAPNGCTGTTTVTVNEDNILPTANAGTGATLNCFASEVVLNGTGSSSGSNFNYQWTTSAGNITSGGNSLTPTVNEAGTYQILVTNTANGCTNTSSVVIEESPPVLATISSSSFVDCFGASTGSASVSASGGDESFSYLWSNGSTNFLTENLVAGEYSVTVTDGEGCTSSTSVTIEQPPVIDLMASATGQTAVGVSDGTASASATGGTPNFSFLWSNGETTPNLTDLDPGNYSVTVTDANGCTAEQSVTVSEFDCIVTAQIEHMDISCNGLINGSATVELANAENPIEYIWSNGEETATIENLEAGVYSVSATDNNGCEVVTSVTIMEPSVLSANATTMAETAAGANDGSATASPTGGTFPFDFEWSNGEGTATISNLSPGTYSVTVTDANGCETVQEITVFPFGCQVTSSISAFPPSCANTENGQATVALTGGIAPFEYEWSNGGNTATIENLPAGTYSVTVLDDGGCEVIDAVTLEAPPAIDIEVISLTNSGCGVNSGAASVSAEGGTGTLSYLWPSGNTSPTEEALGAGTYQVTVSDENECEEILDIVIGSEDVSPPEVFTQNIEVVLDEMGNAEINPSLIDNGSLDDCEIESLDLSQSMFDCSDLGENTVTLTATDPTGNMGQATAIVTVIDNTPPMLETTTVTLGLNTSGTATLPPGILVVSSSDNCGPVSLSASPTEFVCKNLGQNIVTLIAADPSGNETVQEVTINIVDEVNPTIVCPDDLEASFCDPVVEYEVSFSDNCQTSNDPELVEGLASGESFPQGQTTVVYEVVDNSGNSATCEFEVNVTDEIAVSNVVINDEVGTSQNGSIDVTLIGGSTPFTYNWEDENGNFISSEEDVDGLSAGDYTLEVTDNNGCTFSITYTVDMVSAADENNWENGINIFPNPTSGKLFIELPTQLKENTSIVIYDVIGHVCHEKNIANFGLNTFDFINNPSGVYLVKIISGDYVFSKRIVLSK